MLRADVGDQLIGPGRTPWHGEILGVVIRVHGQDGGPPFTIRWYDDGSASKLCPNPERYWIRSRRQVERIEATNRGMRTVA